jgi:4'-phosphopantetheinyl transferase
LNQDKNSKDSRFAKPDLDTWKLANDIHIWRFPLAKISSPLLSEDEYAPAGRFFFEADRNRFISGRHFLRLALSKYLFANPLDISISLGASKKPFILHPSTDIHFNISHSGEWILMAIAKDELGVDVERLNEDFSFSDLLDQHFSEAEQKYIQSLPDAPAAFFYLWTRKEALTKAWGTGLQENLKHVSVLPEDILYAKNELFWKLRSFSVSDGYPAAIAYSGKPENLFFFNGSGLT